jgi:hypothetical protein
MSGIESHVLNVVVRHFGRLRVERLITGLTGFAPEFENVRQGKTLDIDRFVKNAISEKHGAVATLAQI